MKEVDKQWNKKGCNSIDECERVGDCRDCKNIWKAGFKTALEWIKYKGVLEPGLANDLIDEELKE